VLELYGIMLHCFEVLKLQRSDVDQRHERRIGSESDEVKHGGFRALVGTVRFLSSSRPIPVINEHLDVIIGTGAGAALCSI
jgi:hypothetical protein